MSVIIFMFTYIQSPGWQRCSVFYLTTFIGCYVAFSSVFADNARKGTAKGSGIQTNYLHKLLVSPGTSIKLGPGQAFEANFPTSYFVGCYDFLAHSGNSYCLTMNQNTSQMQNGDVRTATATTSTRVFSFVKSPLKMASLNSGATALLST